MGMRGALPPVRMKRYWLGFVFVLLASFAVLGFTGVRIYQTAPPVPERVVTASGREVFAAGEIAAGQNVWQAAGGMEMGSVWGHGSYVAPDWTADWLHRESLYILERWAQTERGVAYDEASPEVKAALQARLTQMMRVNGYDAETRTLTIGATVAFILGVGRREAEREVMDLAGAET
jgi:nitric oxide reductase subunit B